MRFNNAGAHSGIITQRTTQHLFPGERERTAGTGLSRPGSRESTRRFVPFPLSRISLMNTMPLSAAASRLPLLPPRLLHPPDAGAALAAAASMLLADLEHGRAIDARALRTAMIAAFGGSDAEGRLGLEDRLRFLRSGANPVPAQVRARHARTGCVAIGVPAHAGQAGGAAADTHAPVRGEPGAPAILDAHRTRLRRERRGSDHAYRPRARAFGRHRPACHPCRARGRQPGAERARRHARATCSAGFSPAPPSPATTQRKFTTISTPRCVRASC